jgi:hypothetical protein
MAELIANCIAEICIYVEPEHRDKVLILFLS